MGGVFTFGAGCGIMSKENELEVNYGYTETN